MQRTHRHIKKICLTIALLSALLLPLNANAANIGPGADSSLLQVTKAVNEYAQNIVKPRLNHIPSEDRLQQFLEIINVLLDPKDGIASSGLSVPDFMNLAQKSGQQIVSPDSELLDELPDNKRENLRILHNKYMLKHVTGIFFGPSAHDIIKYRSAFGCSHYARAFISIVKALNLVENPVELRYVVSSKYDDYNKCVDLKGAQCPTINGHQFVLVKIQNNWVALNTNRRNDYVVFPEGFTPDLNLKKTNIPIIFNKIPGVIFLLRKIGKDYSDDCGDNSLVGLMNISRSGESNSSELGWGKFFLQTNISTNTKSSFK
jgi:hypothetical protein